MPGGEKIKICNNKMINIVDSREAGTAAHTRVPSPMAHGPAACSHRFCSSLCPPPLPLPHAPLRTQVFWLLIMLITYLSRFISTISPKSLSCLNPIISTINKKKVLIVTQYDTYALYVHVRAYYMCVCVVCTCVDMYIHTYSGMTALGDIRESLD